MGPGAGDVPGAYASAWLLPAPLVLLGLTGCEVPTGGMDLSDLAVNLRPLS